MIMIFNSTKLVKLMKNDNFHRKKKSSDYLVKLRSPWKNKKKKKMKVYKIKFIYDFQFF